MDRPQKRSSLLALLAFAIPSVFLALVSVKLHYSLPTPGNTLSNPHSGLPQISESHILEKVRVLSETIGYRTVGTHEHALADDWMLQEANELKAECERLVKNAPEDAPRFLECEVFRQEGSGTHRFDMMDKRVYKNYVNLSNIVFRLSNGTAASKEHSVIVNAHLDSTLPSPGASDDALPCAIMLDTIRVLINTPGWTPYHSIVFLWNNAEESLQDGSHLFATQNDLMKSARAVVNLESAGISGPELLFQATSEEMIQAYSHVPRPYGTVLANDVFSSGIIMSDTDFRQFQHYGNLTGLDMAIVGDSYAYHTRQDIVDNIEPGVAQHMGENVLALLQHLASPSSPLPRMEQYTPPSTIYLAFLGRYFVMWSFETGTMLYSTLFYSSIFLLTQLSPSRGFRVLIGSITGTVGGLLGAVASANVVALIMTKVLKKSLTWFVYEWSALVLFGVPALIGLLSMQYITSSLIRLRDREYMEFATISTMHLIFAGGASVVHAQGIGSSSVGFIWGLSTFAVVAGQIFLSRVYGVEVHEVWAGLYAAGQFVPALVGTELSTSLLDIFVPLAGRIGEAAPGEHIVATISAVLVYLCVPFVIPLAHRVRRQTLRLTIVGLTLLSGIIIAVFAGNFIKPFDVMHPRRLFVLHNEDINTGALSLHISVADAAPGFSEIVSDIAKAFSLDLDVTSDALQPIHMNDWNPNWDVLYPFSQVLTPYQLPLPSPPSAYVSPWVASQPTPFIVSTRDEKFDSRMGERHLTLVISHPGLIWSNIAFDAHVLAWSLDDSPIEHYTRHHVKEASYYGTNVWELPLVLNATTRAGNGNEWDVPRITVNYQGIQERAMWPAKKSTYEASLKAGKDIPLAMTLFEKLDQFLEERSQGALDVMLLGTVSGIVTL